MLFGKYINKYYKKYFLFFLFGIIALIMVDFFQLKIPEYYGELIDGLKDGTIRDNTNRIKEIMYGFGIVALIMFLGRFIWRYCIFGTAYKIESDIRDEMFYHSESLSQNYYKEHKTGALMALYTNDLQAITEFFGPGTVMLIDSIFLGAFALYKMIRLKWQLALFSCIPMVFIAILAIYLCKKIEQKFKQRQESYEHLSDFTQESFTGISVIKAFVKEIQEVKEFNKINRDNYDKNIGFVKFVTILDVLLTFVIGSIIAVIVGGGSYFVINDSSFTIGNLTEYVAYFDTLVWPFLAFAQLINMRAQAKASLNRINELLDSTPEIIDNDTKDIEIKGKIEFKHLSFKYQDSSINALNDVSFVINQGEMVGIIGKTGCGKTTIVDLLLRIYNVDLNQIFIDDTDIMNLPFKRVRDSIGYVPQDNFLFSDTIANNIAFAFEGNDDEKIENAAMLADVHENIIEFKDKYKTILGERGVTLSGGQKQRVSIARAIIKNPSILILDDSVSAVDTNTEENIISNLKKIRSNKTTIFIAHRISTVKQLDKIIIVDEGKILGVGTFDELNSNCHEFKEMVRLQSLEKEIEGGTKNE